MKIPKTKTKRKLNRKRPSVPVSVKQYVNSTIHKQIENKIHNVQQTISFAAYAESLDFNAFPITPQTGYHGIGQGVGQGARTGNSIKVRKVTLSYVLYPLAYDAITNPSPVPQEVQLLLGYVRNTPSYVPAGGDVAQIFQSGNNVQAPFSNLRDIIASINKDYWVIKKRWTHKIGYAIADGTGSVAAQQYLANNDFALNVKKVIDITKYIPSTLHFNDSPIGTTSRGLYFMFYAVSANGATTGSTLLSTKIDYWIEMEYEDA